MAAAQMRSRPLQQLPVLQPRAFALCSQSLHVTVALMWPHPLPQRLVRTPVQLLRMRRMQQWSCLVNRRCRCRVAETNSQFRADRCEQWRFRCLTHTPCQAPSAGRWQARLLLSRLRKRVMQLTLLRYSLRTAMGMF